MSICFRRLVFPSFFVVLIAGILSDINGVGGNLSVVASVYVPIYPRMRLSYRVS